MIFDKVADTLKSPLADCRIKLVDFGLARLLPEPHTSPMPRRRSSADGILSGLAAAASRSFSTSPLGSREGSAHGPSLVI